MGTWLTGSAGNVANEPDQPVGEVAGQQSHPMIVDHVAQSPAPRPYPPGWVDRFTDWVRTLPVPPWVFYLALGTVQMLAYMALLLDSADWANGTITLSTLLVYSFLSGMTCAYLFGLMHYLDDSAAAALARFRPVLAVDESEYNALCYRLTTLPARSTWIASGVGVLYTFATLLMEIITLGTDSTGVTTPFVAVLIWVSNLVIYVVVAVMVYHTLHQLRMVNAIYTKHTRINLFQLGPLYALSGVTARTAIGIAIPTYAWFQVNSSSAMGATTPDIIQTVLLGITIVITFIWPLLGAHGLLAREKQRLQDEVARRMEAIIGTLHNRIDGGQFDSTEALKETLDGLVAEQGVIDKLRTWPWRTETLSALGLALLVPILIYVVQRILERLGI